MRLLIDMESQMEDFQLRSWATRSNRFLHFLVPAEEVQENETQEWLGRLKETEKKARSMPLSSVDHAPSVVALGCRRHCYPYLSRRDAHPHACNLKTRVVVEYFRTRAPAFDFKPEAACCCRVVLVISRSVRLSSSLTPTCKGASPA